jgi:hypothetical protein
VGCTSTSLTTLLSAKLPFPIARATAGFKTRPGKSMRSNGLLVRRIQVSMVLLQPLGLCVV